MSIYPYMYLSHYVKIPASCETYTHLKAAPFV